MKRESKRERELHMLKNKAEEEIKKGPGHFLIFGLRYVNAGVSKREYLYSMFII